MIEFWSYKRELHKHKKEIHLNIKKTLNSGQIFFGKEINRLERNFIKKYKSKYAIAVGSGTDALLISLKSLGIKQGDEVITAANTAIPTISAIRSVGAIPKLVDIFFAEYLCQLLMISDIAVIKLMTCERAALTRDQIIHNADLMTCSTQDETHVRANVTSTPCDQYFHTIMLLVV